MTTAVLLVLLGALSRLLPHPPNFVPLGGLALYAGARLPRRHAFGVAFASMAVSDLFIDFGTGRPVVTPIRIAVYGSFAAIVVLGRLARAARPFSLAGWSVCGSVLFFLVTNFANWLQFDTYPHTSAGLLLCYAAAVPWFWNTLTADLLGQASSSASARSPGRGSRGRARSFWPLSWGHPPRLPWGSRHRRHSRKASPNRSS